MEPFVEIEHNNQFGSFYIRIDEKVAATMSFIFEGKNRISIEHTAVEPEFNGKGFGRLLVAKVVEFAREKGYKIVPRCEYAQSIFNKTPSYSDVL